MNIFRRPLRKKPPMQSCPTCGAGVLQVCAKDCTNRSARPINAQEEKGKNK